ncbi:Hypothetical protein EIN_073980, partial [Entamoeba invadens IP1]
MSVRRLYSPFKNRRLF